jgi:transcriptional regulator with XRE-family HTH domain
VSSPGKFRPEDKVLATALGKRIRALRVKRNWSQVELAVHADLSRVHVSDLERGTREVGLFKLRKIARAFGTTMARLLKGL